MSPAPDSRSACREAMDLLPWYVAGTLDRAEAARVGEHIARCPACAAEARAEARLAEAVAGLEVEDIGAARGWQALRARLAAEEDGPFGPVGEGRAAARTGPSRQRRRMVRAALGAVATGVAGLLLLWLPGNPVGPPPEGSFRTLSNARSESALPILRLQVAPGTAPERVAALAGDEGLAVQDGPSPRGVYTLMPADGDAPLAERAERLRAQPEVLFVGIREGRQ